MDKKTSLLLDKRQRPFCCLNKLRVAKNKENEKLTHLNATRQTVKCKDDLRVVFLIRREHTMILSINQGTWRARRRATATTGTGNELRAPPHATKTAPESAKMNSRYKLAVHFRGLPFFASAKTSPLKYPTSLSQHLFMQSNVGAAVKVAYFFLNQILMLKQKRSEE